MQTIIHIYHINNKFNIINHMNNMDPIKERKDLIRTLLDKLHTHQDFCANEKTVLSIDTVKESIEFKLYKGKTLYIDGVDAMECPYTLLKCASEECPITTFVSSYNKRLEEYVINNFIKANKVIFKYMNIFTSDNTDKSYSDYDIKWECPTRRYVLIKGVNTSMNKVNIEFNVFELAGHNWDSMTMHIDEKVRTITLSKTFMRDFIPDMFMTPDEFKKFIENKVKNAVFEFVRDATNTMNELTKAIDNETMV